jgi:eukaryotic-like serine/threonine-protein kinase
VLDQTTHDPNGIPPSRPRPPRTLLEATQDYRPPQATRPHRCQVAMPGGTTEQFSDELTNLLRRRLALAATITCAGFLLFQLRNLLLPSGTADFPMTTAEQFLHTAVTVVCGVSAILLWSRVHLCLPRLRAIELMIFGMAAAFFAWLQYHVFDCGEVFRVAREGMEELAVRIAAHANASRWLMLLVIYGTFIPNTWHRCAAVVGAITLTPLTLTAVTALTGCAVTPYLTAAVPDMVLILGMGAAIAIFGSYKISALHQEAFEARKLGQYRLKQRLGEGGMGEVYLAEHMLLRRPCALKLIRPDQAGDQTTLRRFEREVRATATLTHFNTVEIYDYGHTVDGTFYYVMEYLPGLSLQDLVDRHGPVSPERAIHLIRQVCAALSEAHGIGLLHRDIKPSNIIACERGGVYDVAKLLDFGLVRSIGLGKEAIKLTQEGVLAGSPPYMSPEQAKGRNDLDARSDIYSLGSVVYFLLTGQPPFARETAMEMLMAHVYDAVPPPRDLQTDVPVDLQAVVLRCLEKDPAKRFADVASLDQALSVCEAAGRWTNDKAASWWKGVGPAPVAPRSAPTILGEPTTV